MAWALILLGTVIAGTVETERPTVPGPVPPTAMHVCYVLERGRLRPREVWLGPSNPDYVVVEKGLRKGERIAPRDPTAPPSDFGSGAAP